MAGQVNKLGIWMIWTRSCSMDFANVNIRLVGLFMIKKELFNFFILIFLVSLVKYYVIMLSFLFLDFCIIIFRFRFLVFVIFFYKHWKTKIKIKGFFLVYYAPPTPSLLGTTAICMLICSINKKHITKTKTGIQGVRAVYFVLERSLCGFS